jgi:DNA topoisomerase-1
MKTKDFRTAVGTKTARDAMNSIKSPSSQKEYERAVRSVAKTVSERLGNTPTVALQSYIDPLVFAKWRDPAWGGKVKK